MRIELEVVDIRNSQTQSEAFALLMKKKDSDDFLPIIIGISEARAIILEINKITPRRPSPHDLFQQLSAICHCTLQEVSIYKYEEGIYFANIILQDENGKTIFIDSRTSDAVTLALKLKKPIYIDEEIFLEHSFRIEPEPKTILSDEPRNDDEPEVYDDYIDQRIKEMSKEELDVLLTGAIESEDFELASKIHEEIERRMS